MAKQAGGSKKNRPLVPTVQIANKIVRLRNKQVILDRDLARFMKLKQESLNKASTETGSAFPTTSCLFLTRER